MTSSKIVMKRAWASNIGHAFRDEDSHRYIFLNLKDFETLGKPSKVTVTVEAGDTTKT